ncbi:MAG TPA: hypothetical protein PKC39_12110 [Ferruginibacter sp.]|nr:hypothetical protein [Ferruginibacter sp.]
MKRKPLQMMLLTGGLALANVASAQLFIDQATFTIQSGATVTVQGDVTSNVDIQGAGKVILKGSSNQNVNMNGFTVPNVEIDNAANVTLTGAAKVSGVLTFTNGDVLLGNNNLTLLNAASITGASSTKYVVTNGTGRLIKTALGATAFTYPVGKSTTSYTPLAITNSGTADDIGVRAINTVLSAGTTGTAFTKEVVNNTWDINEAVAGGSNLSLTASWATADELAGFDRTRTGISTYLTAPAASVGWDLLNSQVAAATGPTAGLYSATRTGVTSVGSFAVGTRPVLSPLLVSPKVFLQGAYNTGTGLMNDALRTNVNNLIPTTEPYSALTGMLSANNAVRGSGGGETSAANIVGPSAGASTNNTIVDWVLVQLHNGAGTVISQRAALLQRDGDVVDVDGISPVNLAGNAAGTYFVSVKHRNHLGVRTAATLGLAKVSTTNYDFTDGLSKAFAGAVANNAMASVTGSVFALWSGNANDDISVRMTGLNANNNDYLRLLSALGASTNIQTNVYSKQDLNMDGSVRMTGLNANNNDYLRLLSTLGSSTVLVTQPTF